MDANNCTINRQLRLFSNLTERREASPDSWSRPLPLARVRENSEFRLADMPEVTGKLLGVGENRARVQLFRPSREVQIKLPNGGVRRFNARKVQATTISPRVLVQVLQRSAVAGRGDS